MTAQVETRDASTHSTESSANLQFSPEQWPAPSKQPLQKITPESVRISAGKTPSSVKTAARKIAGSPLYWLHVATGIRALGRPDHGLRGHRQRANGQRVGVRPSLLRISRQASGRRQQGPGRSLQ